MSPEQIRGDDLDPRTDIFALGLLLYEMASGRQAFGGKTGGVIIESILTRAPESIPIANPEIPVRLEEIINKCLREGQGPAVCQRGGGPLGLATAQTRNRIRESNANSPLVPSPFQLQLRARPAPRSAGKNQP